jgi:hypothetical protein
MSSKSEYSPSLSCTLAYLFSPGLIDFLKIESARKTFLLHGKELFKSQVLALAKCGGGK